ncbi:MAG: LacI family DNA-binding transcriptional regulator [Spirochaetia bacterium]
MQHFPGKKKKKVTVYDIADELGFSPSTVSRVLNNSSLVGEDTRKRILETADRLGYKKRKIRRHHNRTVLNIRLFLPASSAPHHHLFYDTTELIRSIESGFDGVRVNIIVSSGSYMLQHKKGGDIDGCIFAFCYPTERLLEEIGRWEIPAVYIDREPEEGNYIAVDNVSGMESLLKWLISTGDVKKVLYLGYLPIRDVSERRKEGLARAAQNHGIEFTGDNVFDLESVHQLSKENLVELVQAGFSHFICFNDMIAVYLYQLALSSGYSIPEDFIITGFGNSPVREINIHRFHTVELPVDIMGIEAGRWLKGRIIDKDEKIIRKKITVGVVPGECKVPSGGRSGSN